ncbi:MAG: tyrosine-type recombinase/integrase [Candidatus Dormibacteraceae bacterium]
MVEHKHDPVPIVRLVDEYLTAARARGLSPKTVAHYDATLNSVLLPFCAEEGIADPAALNSRVLEALSVRLLDHGGRRGQLSRFSANSYLRAIRTFVRWAWKEGEVSDEVRVPIPRLPQRVLEVLDRNQIRTIEETCESDRDKVIVRVLADTGLRLSELTGLRIDDLREQGRDRFLRVRGKGRGGQGQERLVPIAPSLYTRLRRYIDRGRSPDADTNRIFVVRRRKDGASTPLQPRTVQDNLRWAAERAGIKQRVTPHLLRHSFATWCLQRNMNPLQLQRILGHSDLTMITRTYSHLSVSDTAAALMEVLREEP